MSTVTASTDYVIRTRFEVPGQIPGLGGLRQQIGGLGDQIGGIGRSIQGYLVGLGAMATSGGFAMLTKQVVALNAEMETAQVGVASLMSAFTGAGMPVALAEASRLVKDLRKDAAMGAGGLPDYLQGIQTIMGPALAMGAGMEQIRELNRLMLNAGFAMRGNQGFELAAMDVYTALTMGAGTRNTAQVLNPILMTQGLTPEAFNKLQGMERIEVLMKAFASMAPAVDAMAQTWSAQFDTFKDQLRTVALNVTGNLFRAWADDLKAANVWLTENAAKLEAMAFTVSDKLVGAYRTLKDNAQGIFSGGVGTVAGSIAYALLPGASAKIVGTIIVGGIAAAVADAMVRFPELTNSLTQSVGLFVSQVEDLVGATGRLAESSIFESGFGWLMGSLGDLWARAATVTLAVMSEVLDTMAVGLQSFFKTFGALGYAFFTGDKSGLKAYESDMVRLKSEWDERGRDRIATVLEALGVTTPRQPTGPVMSEADMYAALGFGPGGLPARETVTNIGTVNIKIEAERLDDPTAVASSFEEVMRRLREYPNGARNQRLMPKGG